MGGERAARCLREKRARKRLARGASSEERTVRQEAISESLEVLSGKMSTADGAIVCDAVDLCREESSCLQ